MATPIFFYGLYMDTAILAELEVKSHQPRPAHVDGYRLRIGNNGTIVEQSGARTFGIIDDLSDDEIHALYDHLPQYASRPITVVQEDGKIVDAVTYTLITPPADCEHNPDYVAKLTACMERLGLPKPEVW